MYLTQSIRRAAQTNPDGLATRFASRSRSWRLIADRVARFAGALRQLGLAAGERVALLSKNRDDYVEWYYAVPWAGGVSVPINIRWSVREMAYCLGETEARVLIVDDHFAASVPTILQTAPSVRAVIHAADGPTLAHALAYEELICATTPEPDVERAPDVPFAIFYTGGTSGKPKGVMLSSLNLWSSAMVLVAECGIVPADKFLHAAPMFHLADAAHTFSITLAAGGHVIVPGFAPEPVLDAINTDQISLLALVPTMLQSLLAHPKLADANTSSLRSIVYGASPISESVLEQALAKFPSVRFIQAYGQTELSPIATILPAPYHAPDDRLVSRRRSAGRATYTTEIKIIDEQGIERPRGAVGEILCRGPNTMLGYWNDPVLTCSTVREGWVHTGDAGYMDAEGFIYVVDRLKDLIITGGENVYSTEVENVLMLHPGIESCAVIGIPDERWGEAVHAIVVSRGGMTIDAPAVITHCRSMIAHYKCPKTVHVQSEPLPISAAGKILKRELREAYWKGLPRRVN